MQMNKDNDIESILRRDIELYKQEKLITLAFNITHIIFCIIGFSIGGMAILGILCFLVQIFK